MFAAIRRDSRGPVRLIDGQVRVLLHANDLVIFDSRQQVARDDRLTGRLRRKSSSTRSANHLAGPPGPVEPRNIRSPRLPAPAV
ncbi:MAG TPA: hypothetical protein VGJ60_29545 [Chloroflexota bacterium]